MILSAVVWVGLLWATVGFAVRRWGPGLAKRRVRCPEKSVVAKLVVLHTEGDFGALRASDVTACSLFTGEPVSCDKACLGRL